MKIATDEAKRNPWKPAQRIVRVLEGRDEGTASMFAAFCCRKPQYPVPSLHKRLPHRRCRASASVCRTAGAIRPTQWR